MYEPSVEAKYFCSLTWNRLEAMKLAPAFIAAALTASSRSTLSLTGTSIGLRTIGVAHCTSPSPLVGASRTGAALALALALAIASAWCVAPATASSVRVLVAANPHAPSASTRTPTPVDSVLTMFSTLSSRVLMNWRR